MELLEVCFDYSMSVCVSSVFRSSEKKKKKASTSNLLSTHGRTNVAGNLDPRNEAGDMQMAPPEHLAVEACWLNTWDEICYEMLTILLRVSHPWF